MHKFIYLNIQFSIIIFLFNLNYLLNLIILIIFIIYCFQISYLLKLFLLLTYFIDNSPLGPVSKVDRWLLELSRVDRSVKVELIDQVDRALSKLSQPIKCSEVDFFALKV